MEILIKDYTNYRQEEILPLYQSVGWEFYCANPGAMAMGYANSLCTLGAWDGDKLVGIIRCVGDGHTILFIQDLLIYPEYQRRGIGTKLMRAVLSRYEHVYQIELATDNTEKTVNFYTSLGFVPLGKLGCCGFARAGRV